MALNAILHRKRSSWWQRLQQAPCSVLAQTLYAARQRIAASTLSSTAGLGITVVCISDTHNMTPELPPGDLLIHAGDLTQGGTAAELQTQLDWLDAQPHRHKVVIAGNHDIVLDEEKSTELGVSHHRRQSLRWGSIVYLERSAVSLQFPGGKRVSIYGHPATRKHGNWAFQYDRGTDVFSNHVEDGIDILVTHSAPRFHLDVAGWGDEFLLRELHRVKPKLHIFGHTHQGHGQDMLMYDRFEELYQRIYAGRGGAFALLHMVLLLLQMSLLLLLGFDRKIERSLLVNASVVGGLLDEQQREVRVVHLLSKPLPTGPVIFVLGVKKTLESEEIRPYSTDRLVDKGSETTEGRIETQINQVRPFASEREHWVDGSILSHYESLTSLVSILDTTAQSYKSRSCSLEYEAVDEPTDRVGFCRRCSNDVVGVHLTDIYAFLYLGTLFII
nr:putative rhamnogalacturonate lyase c [Quercus suber]